MILFFFYVLVHEFDEAEKNETRKKIKGRLRYYKLGEYKQEREDYIRALKNALYAELKKLVSLGTSGHPVRHTKKTPQAKLPLDLRRTV